MYLELNPKFYEILVRKNKVLIRYGKVPRVNKQLPYGKFEIYNFNSNNHAKNVYNKKLEEKYKKGYKNNRTTNSATYDMKWTIKNMKPIKNNSKKCSDGKILNKKTNRCIKNINININKTKNINKFPKIELKKGELGKHGYSKIKDLSVKKRHIALNSAITEFGPHKIITKLGLLKTYQKNKNPDISSKFMNNMKWVRKKYDKQFKSSWKTSNLFK